MKRYTFKFRGRQAGAIGIFYNIQDTYKASSLSEAKSLLYEDYEHISVGLVLQGSTEIDRAEFDAAPFIKVRSNVFRPRKTDGSYY